LVRSASHAADHAGSSPLAAIWVDRLNKTHVLAAAGEIDMSNQEQFRAALEKAASSHRRLVIDLTRVTTMSSHAIGVLYRYASSLTAVYVAHNSLIARALNYSGFASRVPVIVDARAPMPSSG
jgi:anti-anti-sigma factor